MGGERFSDIRALVGVDMLGQSLKYPQIETVISGRCTSSVRSTRPAIISAYSAPGLWLVRPYDSGGSRGRCSAGNWLALLPENKHLQLTRLCTCALVSSCAWQDVRHTLSHTCWRTLRCDACGRCDSRAFPHPNPDHLRFVCMVDGERARDELEFSPRYDLAETMEHLQLTRLLINKARRQQFAL